jgi:glycosyltransferase involved in cell wall biosynthesis
VGSLAPRVDISLIAGVAKTRPDWLIELVGPVLPFVDVSPLLALPNVVLAGEIAYRDVPERIASFDVCLLPLLEIDFAYYCSPIQVFDYLAAGRPVVSTPVAQLERWEGLVRIARGPREFVQAVQLALTERTPADFARRREFAEQNSWDARVERIGALLEQIGMPLAHAGPHVPHGCVAA